MAANGNEKPASDIPALPGVTAYVRTKQRATAALQTLALRLIADRCAEPAIGRLR